MLDEIKNQFEKRMTTLSELNSNVKGALDQINFKSLFEITEFNLADNMNLVVWTGELFRSEYIKEANKMNELERTLQQRIGDLYEHYRFDDPRNLKKTEVEKYFIPRDVQVKQIQEELNRRKLLADNYKGIFELFQRLNRNYRTLGKSNLLT